MRMLVPERKFLQTSGKKWLYKVMAQNGKTSVSAMPLNDGHCSEGELMESANNINKVKVYESKNEKKNILQKEKDVGVKLKSSSRAPSKPNRLYL